MDQKTIRNELHTSFKITMYSCFNGIPFSSEFCISICSTEKSVQYWHVNNQQCTAVIKGDKKMLNYTRSSWLWCRFILYFIVVLYKLIAYGHQLNSGLNNLLFFKLFLFDFLAHNMNNRSVTKNFNKWPHWLDTLKFILKTFWTRMVISEQLKKFLVLFHCIQIMRFNYVFENRLYVYCKTGDTLQHVIVHTFGCQSRTRV